MGDVKRFPPGSTDCHQHVWPPAFLDALREHGLLDGWTLRLPGEPAYEVDPAAHDLAARRRRDHEDGIATTVYSLSSPLGIESMPDGQPLLDAWHALAEDALIWAAPRLVEPDPAELAAILKHDRVVGLQVPATALSTPYALERLAELLHEAERQDLPVLVHPGPAVSPTDAPGWWPALTDYTAQLTAAWFAWHVAGRALLPTLRIAFVGLAGLAPLHHERLAQRGGRLGAIDRFVYYETSSYGMRAIDAMIRVVGIDPIVHGSDLPYAEPTDPRLGEAFAHALFVHNPAHLLRGGDR